MTSVLTSQAPATEATQPVLPVIEKNFAVRDGELLIGDVSVEELAWTYGTPLFVYDAKIIEKRLHELQTAFSSRVDVFYSMKANPNREILRQLIQLGCGIEIASGGELIQALHAGCNPSRILFAGPGKTNAELHAAIEAGIREIHVESIGEAKRLDDLARTADRIVRIALRINPAESVQGGAMRMGGKPTPFGIDEEQLDDALETIQELEHLEISGIHLFTGTQILDHEILLSQYRKAIEIAQRVASFLNRPIETIDFGGGLGIPCFERETPLDLERFRSEFTELLDEIDADPLLARTDLLIEPGRFLVAESGIYLTSVTDVKQSRGKTFVVLDGGMNHHLAASGNLGQTIKRNFPTAIVNHLDQPTGLTADLVGPLCTPLDTLGRNVNLPELAPGDLAAVFLAGAYGRTSSPHGFLSHLTPPEVLVREGEHQLIRRRGMCDDFLADQRVLAFQWH